MGDKTGIQWTHVPGHGGATWNPLRARHRETGAEGWACVKVSPGCVNCYSKVMNEDQRFGRGTGLDYTVPALAQVKTYLDEETLIQPLRWQKPRGVFVCSMTDLFGEWVTDEEIDRVFAVMALLPQHLFMVLTKRPERMRTYVSAIPVGVERIANSLGRGRYHALTSAMWQAKPRKNEPDYRPPWPLPNVWLGVTVEDQARADERIPLLLDTPAAVRFLSCEPLLGPIEFSNVSGRADAVRQLGRPALAGIDWVIVGGESGASARDFDLAWARSLRKQCAAVDVAFFMKQLGSEPVWEGGRLRTRHPHGGKPEEWPQDLRVRQWPGVAA